MQPLIPCVTMFCRLLTLVLLVSGCAALGRSSHPPRDIQADVAYSERCMLANDPASTHAVTDHLDTPIATPRPYSRNAKPRYPLSARRNGIQGDVRVRMAIDTEGRVEGLCILQGPRALDIEVVRALGRWRYEPMRNKDGVAFPFRQVVTLPFRIP